MMDHALHSRQARRRFLIGALCVATSAVIFIATPTDTAARQDNGASAGAPTPGLTPTTHPPVPATLRGMWYAPAGSRPSNALDRLARAVRIVDEGTGKVQEALLLLDGVGVTDPTLAAYAKYYRALALQRLNRMAEAEAAFVAAASAPAGQLPEAATLRHAELKIAGGDFGGAVALYEGVLRGTVSWPPAVLLGLGRAASQGNDRVRAVAALRRIVYEHPLSAEAIEAEPMLDSLNGFALDTPAATDAELARAERLFAARRWPQSRAAFERLRSAASAPTDRDHVTVRLAQVLAATGQHRAAREVLRRFTSHDTLGTEAQYALVVAARVLGDVEGFIQQTEAFVRRYPSSPLAESALNDLARHYVLTDDDEKAAAVYARMVASFPSGVFAERAAWKAGWWAYRQKNYAETIRLFEIGASQFPRSDYRPSWLYWSARAYDGAGARQAAIDRYRLVAADYLNSYYGRLASQRLGEHRAASAPPNVRRVPAPPAPPPTADLISRLIDAGLYRPALHELQYAQKVWGDSPPLLATIALVHNRLGSLRLGISTMKRAYPQYMAAGGEGLPPEILQVLFPIDYWPLLNGHAQARGLDPHVVAALVAQESTFDPVIRSSASAVGLMQIMPATGRRYASRIGIRGFSTRSLNNPEINVRIGTQYFSDLMKRFGAHHLALASYNAGESRVQRWVNADPDLPQDEFIDNIPFPETQNYVKRILGTAEDYRRLYGPGGVLAATPPAATASSHTPRSTPPAPPAPVTKAPLTKAPATKAPAPVKKTSPTPVKKAPPTPPPPR